MEQAINNEYVNKVADMLPSNGKTIDCKFYVVSVPSHAHAVGQSDGPTKQSTWNKIDGTNTGHLLGL